MWRNRGKVNGVLGRYQSVSFDFGVLFVWWLYVWKLSLERFREH